MPLLSSCTNNDVDLKEEKLVYINIKDEIDIDVSLSTGSEPVKAGTTVIATVSNLPNGKICSITSQQVEVKKESSITFSFVMPEQNVYLDVTVKDEVINASSLESLQKGFKLETTMSETIGEATQYSIVETQTVDGKFTLKTYEPSLSENPSKDKMQIFETYYKNDKGNLSAGRLGINNEFKYYEVLLPNGDGVFKWDEDGYKNFFSYLKIENFKLGNDGWFTLKMNDESLKDAYKAIMTQLYGNPGLELEKFSLQVKDGNIIALKTESKPFVGSSQTYKYTFSSKVTSITDAEFEERFSKLEEKQDPEFSKIFEDLNKNNYTLIQEDFVNDKSIGVTTFKVNPDKVYYEVPDEFGDLIKVGYYVKDGFTQEVTPKEDGFYKVGESLEGDIIPELTIKFDVDYSCFDKVDNKYVLKKGIDGSASSFSKFEVAAETLDNLTIEVKDNGYQVVNVYSKYKTVFDFVDVGSTDVGFSAETVKESKPAESWTELVDAETYTSLNDYFGEAFTSLPIPSFISGQFINLSDEAGMALLILDNIPNESWVEEYSSMLESAGYEFLPDEDIFGAGNGKCFANAFLVNDTEMTVFYQVCIYEGLFSILFVDAAVA